MPSIKIEFSVPEQPNRNVVTVLIEGPDQMRVRQVAMETINFYTRAPQILNIPPPEKFSTAGIPDPECRACRMGGTACHNHRG